MMTNHRDFISLFAQHKVAANLLMLIMVLAGFVSLSKLNTQFFPTFALDVITVQIVWRGASAEDVEDSLTSRVENELRSVDYVDKMTSTSSYGSSVVSLEFEEDTDMGKALDDVKNRLDQIRNLPTDSEIPKVTLVTRYENVAKMILTTDGELSELRYLAHEIERDLLDKGIAQITFTGLPDQEIAIQINSQQLESLGLSLEEVSQKINAVSSDLPAGEIGNDYTARQLRSASQARDERAFANIPIKSDYSGGLLLLKDIAEIEKRPMRKQVSVFYQGKPAIELTLDRGENSDTLKSAEVLQTWLDEHQNSLPEGVDVVVYDASWQLIKERINLLLNNGLSGLILVVGILFLFLHGRVAWWVAVGIPVSFMATLFVMYAAGGSINMISLFALIMALGIIVDDAIVVGFYFSVVISKYPPISHSKCANF